jgi:hypothetical protein
METLVAITNAQRSIGSAFAGIPQVESVYVHPVGEVFRVFTIVDDVDEDTYDRIYEHERSIMHTFRELHFDFNVIARRGRSEKDLISSATPAWRRTE